MNEDVKKIVISAMFAAMVCVATMIIQIPSPMKGYINLGDGIVLFAGWYLSPLYGFLAAGIGAVLADVFAGYMMYAPVTFAVKGCMALAAWYGFRILNKRIGRKPSRILSGAAAEVIMILGYFAYEAFLYGIPLSAMNIPMNLVQGVAGVSVGTILMEFFEKNRLTF